MPESSGLPLLTINPCRTRSISRHEDTREESGIKPPRTLNAGRVTTREEETALKSTTKPMSPQELFLLDPDISVVMVIINKSSRLPATVWEDNIQAIWLPPTTSRRCALGPFKRSI